MIMNGNLVGMIILVIVGILFLLFLYVKYRISRKLKRHSAQKSEKWKDLTNRSTLSNELKVKKIPNKVSEDPQNKKIAKKLESEGRKYMSKVFTNLLVQLVIIIISAGIAVVGINILFVLIGWHIEGPINNNNINNFINIIPEYGKVVIEVIVLSLCCLPFYLLYNALKSLSYPIAGETIDITCERFYRGILSREYYRSYVCLTSERKEEYGTYREFRDYWLSQTKIINGNLEAVRTSNSDNIDQEMVNSSSGLMRKKIIVLVVLKQSNILKRLSSEPALVKYGKRWYFDSPKEFLTLNTAERI
jgi:hypothetical protein